MVFSLRVVGEIVGDGAGFSVLVLLLVDHVRSGYHDIKSSYFDESICF